MSQTAAVAIDATEEGFALEIDRIFKAPRERVYAAWTDPAQLAQWWGPQGMTCPECDWNPAVGATYRTCMQNADGDKYCVGGVFQEVTPPEKLVFTWKWEDPGETGGADTLVTVELEDLGGETRLKLTHDRMPTEEAATNHNGGWSSSFEDLDLFLGT